MMKLAMKLVLSFALFAAMFAYAMFQGGFVSWFLFYSVVPLLIFAFATALYPLKSIQVKREPTSPTFSAGEVLEMKISIKKTFFPLFYLIVKDQLPDELRKESDAKAIFFPFFSRHMSFTYEIDYLPRGEHRFSDIRLSIGDPFGFVQKKALVATEVQTIVVYPRIHYIDWQPAAINSTGAAKQAHVNGIEGDTVAGIRDYALGDRLSWLDWKASAKRNKWMSKQFEQQKDEEVLLFLDNSRLSYDNESTNVFERAVQLTASLLNAAIRHRGKAGLPLMEEDQLERTKSGYERSASLYYLLAKVKAEHPKPFSELVAGYVSQYPLSGHYVFITANLSKDLFKQLDRLALMKRRVELFFVANIAERKEDAVRRLRQLGVTVHIITDDGQPGFRLS